MWASIEGRGRQRMAQPRESVLLSVSRRRMLRCYMEENGVTPKMGDALDEAVMWHVCKMWGVRE